MMKMHNILLSQISQHSSARLFNKYVIYQLVLTVPPLLADFFLYLFIQRRLKKWIKLNISGNISDI